MIRSVQIKDVPQLADLYNFYVQTSSVTFEEDLVSIPEFEQRVNEISAKYPYLVYEENGRIVGYAYAGAFRTRVAYRFACETSVYIHKDHFRKGIAYQLYDALLKALIGSEFKTAIGGITLPNESSVSLHEKFGFQKVAEFKSVGYKFNQWYDVGFWQKLL